MNDRLDAIRALLEQSPADAFLNFALAQELRNRGEVLLAISSFERLREQHPSYVGLYYHLAACLLEVDRVAEAMQTYDLGIKLAQSLGDSHALAELRNAKMNVGL